MVKVNRESDFSDEIEKTRLLSDNFNAYLIPKDSNGTPLNGYALNLGNLGLKRIKWDMRTESIKFTPVTRRDEICIVKFMGFDFEFSFGKNSFDMMYLMLGQHAYNHAQAFGLSLDNLSFKLQSESSDIGIQKRTEFKEGKQILSTVASNWDSQNRNIRTENISPKYDLKINIQHYNTLIESYLFKNFTLESGSQETEENSSDISESFKGHAGWVELVGTEIPNFSTIKILQESYNREINDGTKSLRKVSNSKNLKLLSDFNNTAKI